MTSDQRKRPLPRVTPERLTELARGIARGDYLIADDSKDWLLSLSMMGEAISSADNLGLILVPVNPHLGGYWLNGSVPGVTITCVLVALEDVPELQTRVETMMQALFPDDA